jgi:hypothetical protein
VGFLSCISAAYKNADYPCGGLIGVLFLTLFLDYVYFTRLGVDLDECLALRTPNLRLPLQVNQSAVALRAANLF